MKRIAVPWVAGLTLLAWASCKDEGVLYLTSVNDEPSGANCADGGNKLNFGADADANGQLDAAEITASAFVCNGAASRGALVTSTALQPGDADCPSGGYLLTVGLDRNGNGAVDTEEAASSRKVCNGASGAAGPQGSNGTAADAGPSGPPGADGTTGANGTTGDAGPAGPDGKSSLLLVSPEDPGGNCSEGGLKVEVGIDADGDTVLDPGEIDGAQTHYVCNTAALCSVSNQCDDGKVCDPATHHCVIGECGTNADCAVEDVCTALHCGVCTATPDCDPGELCNTQNGECVVGDCLSNADCDATEACVSNHCGACGTSADCDSNEVCETTGNTCVVGDCLTNSDCSGGLACLSFTCSPCTVTAQCDGGQVCLLATNTCGVGCDTVADCDHGDSCDSQVCVDPCTSPDGTCPDLGDVCQLNSSVACEWVCAPDTEVPGLTLPLNGGFETGDFRHWHFLDSQEPVGPRGHWSVLNDGVTVTNVDQVCDQEHEALASSGSPGLPTTYAATDGSHLASLLVSGPGNHRLFQDVAVGATQDQLLFDLTYKNSNDLFDPSTQYFAVNVRNPTDDSVLATLFKTTEGVDPETLAMTPFTLDISAFQGQTVRIDFETQIQDFFFDVALDNVRVVTGP